MPPGASAAPSSAKSVAAARSGIRCSRFTSKIASQTPSRAAQPGSVASSKSGGSIAASTVADHARIEAKFAGSTSVGCQSSPKGPAICAACRPEPEAISNSRPLRPSPCSACKIGSALRAADGTMRRPSASTSAPVSGSFSVIRTGRVTGWRSARLTAVTPARRSDPPPIGWPRGRIETHSPLAPPPKRTTAPAHPAQ